MAGFSIVISNCLAVCRWPCCSKWPWTLRWCLECSKLPVARGPISGDWILLPVIEPSVDFWTFSDGFLVILHNDFNTEFPKKFRTKLFSTHMTLFIIFPVTRCIYLIHSIIHFVWLWLSIISENISPNFDNCFLRNFNPSHKWGSVCRIWIKILISAKYCISLTVT